MSLKAYEDACDRAELFGQPVPDKEDFLAKHKHLDVAEFEEVEIKTAEDTAMLDDHLKQGSAGLAELNTILNSTQTKLNRLKGVCGTLTNFFRIKITAKDNLSYSSEPSYVGQKNYDKDYVPRRTEIGSVNEGLGGGPEDVEMTPRPGNSKMASAKWAGKKQDGGDINAALQNLQQMENIRNTNLEYKGAMVDISKQVNTQLSKLDQMVNQADRAQAHLNSQNRQIRSYVKK